MATRARACYFFTAVMIRIQPNIQIEESEITEHFIRASGPGGQHVNKTASAVQLRFNVRACPGLPSEVRERLLTLAAARINREGELVIEAKRYRSQDRNRADARQRLTAWIERASNVPKRRKPTRPTRASKEKRLTRKKQHGRRKSLRQTPDRAN